MRRFGVREVRERIAHCAQTGNKLTRTTEFAIRCLKKIPTTNQDGYGVKCLPCQQEDMNSGL